MLDTAAVSDALDSLGIAGVLAGIRPLVPSVRCCGPAYTVRYRERGASAEFQGAPNYIDDVPEGAVVVVDNGGRTDCTNWGSLLTEVARSRGIAGTVLHGSARDYDEISAGPYPVFCTAVTMVSGKNRVELDGLQEPIDIAGVEVRPGDYIVADGNGAIRVPADKVDEVVSRAEQVDRTEAAIAAAVRQGSRLDHARATFNYARPWDASDG